MNCKKAFSCGKVRRCLKTVSLQTPDESGPGALAALLSAKSTTAPALSWPARNDSEAFDDAVATMLHSLPFSQSKYFEMIHSSNFEMSHGKRGLSDFIATTSSQRLRLSGARGDLDFASPVASHTLFVGSVG